MTDPVSYGILVAAALIVGAVLILLFTRSPERRRAPEGMGSALLALSAGDHEAARKLLTDFVRRADASPEAVLVLGRLLREAGETDRAAALHRTLLARPRLQPELRLAAELELGSDLLAAGRGADALGRIADLEKHFRDPRIVDLHARALVVTGRLESAAEVWRDGVRSDSDPARRRTGTRFLAEIAREYLRLGQPETAERWARQALRLEADTGLAHVVLGDIERNRGHDRNAREHYEDALGHGGAPWVLPRLIDHALSTGQVDRLIDTLEPMRQDHPEEPSLARAVLDLRLRRGEREEFFALLESEDLPVFADPAVWASWTRHLVAAEDAPGLDRLLARLPAAFGPRTWRCAYCGAEDHEPRAACLACGAPEDLVPQTTGDVS
jgi:lipopolysaccharide biosynthesis regulator YciM